MKTETPAKTKAFQTAARLFYQQGYRATGVDSIAAESGVGKMTLYRHFPSKDELIVAFLADADGVFWQQFDHVTGSVIGAREKILAFFTALQEYALSPECYGCPFINAAVEYPEAENASHQKSVEHKRAVQARFTQLAVETGARQPEALANALVLLMDGAYTSARMFGVSKDSPVQSLVETVRLVLAAYP